MIPQHSFDVQMFHGYCLVFTSKPCRYLVKEIPADICDTLMNASNTDTRSFTIHRLRHLSGKPPLLSAEPESVLTSWDDSPFALEGDGSTRFEPPAELDLASEFVLEPEVPEPAPLEPSLVLPASAPMALPVEAPVVEALPAPVFAAPPAEIPAVAPVREVLAPAGELRLADSDIERIARRVVELLGPQVLRDVAWEVVPDLAEVAIRARIRELEAELE